MKKIVLVTGGFDPLHSGHIEYFKAAQRLGDELWVGLNSDEWLVRKKGQYFMPIKERASIVSELKSVKQVITGFKDDDDSSSDAIRWCHLMGAEHVVFANGGDRQNYNTPEQIAYKGDQTVTFKFGVGGKDKKNSSSWILDEWRTQKTIRDWGYWRVLDDKQPRIGHKVKELVINPGCSLSDQRHQYRNEIWYVLEGQIQMDLQYKNGERLKDLTLTEYTNFMITSGTWHKVINTGDKPAHVVEIQYGQKCEEDDIERR